MEQKIEEAVDRWLESISFGLYVYSIVLGIVLIFFGIFLLIKNRRAKEDKGLFYGSLSCFVLGLIAVTSGLVQM